MSDHGAVPAGWYPDPEGRFEHRYFNGVAWTRDVSIDGRRYYDDGSSPSSGQPPAPQRGGTLAMVLGIVAASVAWLPLLFALGLAGGIAAIAIGVSVRRRAATGSSRTFATIGAWAGGAAVALSAGGLWFTVVAYRAIDDYENPARHEAQVTSCSTDGRLATFAGSITNGDDDRASFTLRLEFDRAGSARTLESVSHEVNDVDPGETREFEVRRRVSSDDVDCRVARVDGPLPFGLDLG